MIYFSRLVTLRAAASAPATYRGGELNAPCLAGAVCTRKSRDAKLADENTAKDGTGGSVP